MKMSKVKDEWNIRKLFCSFDQEKQVEENQEEEENLGFPTIKYGETIVFVRHVDSDLWISYETLELTIKGIGKVEEKRVESSLHLTRIVCLLFD